MKTKNKYQLKASRFFVFTLLSMVLLVGVKYSLDKSNLRNAVLESIRTGIAPENLIEFSFSKEESLLLNWKKDHEFELKGEMYDIVSTETFENQLIYHCFHDTKESKYKRRFYKWIGQWLLPEGDNSSDDKNSAKSYKSYYCQVITDVYSNSITNLKSGSIYPYTNNYFHLISGPNSPPPQF